MKVAHAPEPLATIDINPHTGTAHAIEPSDADNACGATNEGLHLGRPIVVTLDCAMALKNDGRADARRAEILVPLRLATRLKEGRLRRTRCHRRGISLARDADAKITNAPEILGSIDIDAHTRTALPIDT